MARPFSNRVTYGDAIVSRFTEIGISKSSRLTSGLQAQHVVFVKATVTVEKAEHGYDDAATRISKLDVVRDKTILALADKVPGAGLGERASPFARYSKYPPTKLVGLPYAAQTNRGPLALTEIRKANPAKEIAALCDDGEKQNEAVNDALGGPHGTARDAQ